MIPAVRELTGAAQEMEGVLADAAGAYDGTASSVLAAAGVADTYIGKLKEMGDYAQLSEADQREYHNILELLCQTVPELADSIDLENNVIRGGTAALAANTEAWKQNALAQAYQDRLTAMYAAQADVLIEAEENSLALTKAQTSLDAAEKKRAETLDRMNDLYRRIREADGSPEKVRQLQSEYDQLSMSLGDVENEIWRSQRAVDVYTQAMEEDQAAVDAARAEMEKAEEAVRSLTNAADEQAGSSLPELDAALSPVRDSLAQLALSYEAAYHSALESISGQYSLWDEAADIAATSAGSINAALESQITYWENYNANLASLGERSADIAGLSGMIASFADGSADSVNAIAGMAQASDGELRTMVANWQALQEQQAETSESMAELVSGFPEQVAGLVEALEQGVEDMRMPDEAQRSARETIQSFIDQAEDLMPVVRDAYARLGRTAANALGVDLGMTSSGHSGDAGHVDAYASGTSNAPPGWAWVGEEGPELMRMHGGETVLPADVSRQFAALTANSTAVYNSASYQVDTLGAAPAAIEAVPSPGGWDFDGPVTVEVHIHIEGNAGPETVQALEDYVSRRELKAAVKDAVADMQSEARRRDWF